MARKEISQQEASDPLSAEIRHEAAHFIASPDLAEAAMALSTEERARLKNVFSRVAEFLENGQNPSRTENITEAKVDGMSIPPISSEVAQQILDSESAKRESAFSTKPQEKPTPSHENPPANYDSGVPGVLFTWGDIIKFNLGE